MNKIFANSQVKILLILGSLIIISIPAVKSLLVPGGFTSHDLTHHVVRQVQMHQILSEGQFPPRWTANLNSGFGYPVFLFIYPLPYLTGELFYLSGFNFVESVKAVMLLSMFGSVLTMFWFLRELLGAQYTKAAFLGAVFYLYAPIRLSIVYVSASVGSALALAIIPLVFWTILRVIKEGKQKYVLIGALSVALLITAHNVTALIFAPLILVFSLISLKIYSAKFILKLILMFLWGAGMSAFFWLPAIWEKQYVIYDSVLSKFWVDQFPTLKQLIYSPWGYGLSHPGVEQDAMSFQIGIAQILVAIILAGLLIFKRSEKQLQMWGVFSLAFFGLSIFLMLDSSTFVWKNLPMIGYIQFPYRISMVVMFVCALAVALIIKFIPHKNIMFVLLLGLVLYANRNHLNVNQRFDPGDDYYVSLQTTSSTFGEHLPKWANRDTKPTFSKVEFIDGVGGINTYQNNSDSVKSTLKIQSESEIKFNQYYFPGWEIRVDGKVVDINYLQPGENYGFPVFKVSEGEHALEAKFKNTAVRNIADGISFITLVLWLVGLIFIAFVGKKYTILSPK